MSKEGVNEAGKYHIKKEIPMSCSLRKLNEVNSVSGGCANAVAGHHAHGCKGRTGTCALANQTHGGNHGQRERLGRRGYSCRVFLFPTIPPSLIDRKLHQYWRIGVTLGRIRPRT